jgi:REP element-mobilizing transposase RayT/CheY-like chemotaxis protein
MPVHILIGTPHKAFGELLRGSLQDSGQYQANLMLSAEGVLDAVKQSAYDIAILDSALPGQSFVSLCSQVLAEQKDIRLVVVPPENNPNHPALGGLLPHGYLKRPFYLPDLIETMSKIVQQNAGQASSGQSSAGFPVWLQEPLTLRGYLESELANTHALAAIAGLYGPAQGVGSVRAWAGQFSDPGVQELAAMVFRYWNRSEKTDLMRFMRLSAEKSEYLVYATHVAGDMVLIMAYETSMPLSQIRPQTKTIAQKLATTSPEGYQATGSLKKGVTGPQKKTIPEKPAAVKPSADFSEQLADMRSKLIEPPAGGAPGNSQRESPDTRTQTAPGDRLDTDQEEFDESHFINLSALLGSVPAPDPGKSAFGGWKGEIPTQPPPGRGFNGWVPDSYNSDPTKLPSQDRAPESTDGPQGADGRQDADVAEELRKMQAALNLAASTDHAKEEGVPDSPAASSAPLPKTQPLRLQELQSIEIRPERPSETAIIPEPENELDNLEDTRPRLVTTLTHLDQLEPVSPAISLLNYTCVLVPRLPQHYLTGSLADLLATWVAQLCVAFGWRLEGISIRPEYVQWTVQVAPSVSPGNLVKIIRQRTSMHIFNSFAHLREQNPSGDFWAAGYLIVSGAQPPSPQLLRDFIGQTRKRQGIAR